MPAPDAVLPRDARLVALLISSCPSITDAHPSVLLQLLEFANRYTSQVLSDALVYSEHAGRGGSVDEEDVKLAVQSRVGWEFGGRVPKEFLLTLAAKTNAKPLPPVPEVFGVRLPPAKHCLTAVDFDLIPNKPPPGVSLNDENDEDEEEAQSEEDEGFEDDYDGPGGGIGLAPDDMEMADGSINLFSMPGERSGGGDDEQGDEGGGGGEEDLFGEADEEDDMVGMEDGGDLDLGDLAGHSMPNGIGVGEKRRADDDDDDYDA
ncbi:Transcription initiation factor TFIID subunit 9 [Tulasnella sp. JGI-2019a]|nr:Transcription initiation factor TFIID subunit 9 [Tulasnella sp. JGI-2019a]KAG9016157.1 Transcription initiation factor TFIID subunit 9 [Tulasnella sp. JGI-2019a]KAG9032950.1 Transcription initiation factor TFIID subunit 9 [Tulasnella sp. JGI-2019a]